MGGFKGKVKQGLKFSRAKKSTFLLKRKRTLYSPRRPSTTKKCRLTTPAKFSLSKNKRCLILTPSSARRTPKRLNFTGTKTDLSLVTPQFRMPTEILDDLGCTQLDDENDDHPLKSESLRSTECNYQEENVDEVDIGDDVEKMKEMLPGVVKNLKKHGKLDIVADFFKLVKENRFPMTNISFMLWCDLVKWLSNNDTRAMRYSTECMEFFWVGKKIFGGKFLRFMGGLRNESELLKGGDAFDPENARINFACPSTRCVNNYQPLGGELPETFEPGLMNEMIKYKVENDRDAQKQSYVLMLDGKKMKRSTDVDLLGFEKDKTLKEKHDERKKKDEILSIACDTLNEITDENISDTSDTDRPVIFAAFMSILLLFSTVLRELRNLKTKKNYALNKLKELAGDDWRKSKYSYSIDLNMTLIWKIENCMDKCMQILRAICKAGAHLNKVGHLFANESVIDLNRQANLRVLKSLHQLPDEYKSDTSVIKQRSDKWMEDRKKMKVTGSTIYQAIGMDTLKSQREHFDRKVYGIETKNINEAQQKAMDHGTQSEVHHLATMCSVILPFMFPESTFFEEGYYIDNNVLVSPDGSIRCPDGKPKFAFEGKSPIEKEHVSTIHESVPTRYITQTLFESMALKTEGTLYLCWTESSCSLFKVPFNAEICEDITREIENVYHVEHLKRPTRRSETSKKIKEDISGHVKECVFLGEFPSVKGKLEDNLRRNDSDTTSPYETQLDGRSVVQPYTYDELRRTLLLGREVITDSYELQRTMATQVVVYLLADIDRYWKHELPHAIPVLYFYRGYSLSMETTKQITEMCKAKCRESGLDVIVTAADGEFHSIMVRGRENRPLTQHQLSKDVWDSLANFSKNGIVQFFLEKSKPPSSVENERQTVLESQNKTMRLIKTPSRGWDNRSKQQKEDSKVIPIEQESDETEMQSVSATEDNNTELNAAQEYENTDLDDSPTETIQEDRRFKPVDERQIPAQENRTIEDANEILKTSPELKKYRNGL